MTEPSQYFKGRTVQEQMNEVIGYVDTRAAEVATNAIAANVAQVHRDMLDADADAAAAAASAAAAARTLANAVKKTGEASQSIAGDIAVAGNLSGGSVTVPAPVNNTDAATKKYVDDQDALDVKLAGNQTIADVKIFSSSPVVPTVATGTADTKAANGTKVKNELDNYAPMVRTTGNQSISGEKKIISPLTLSYATLHMHNSGIQLESDGIDLTNPPSFIVRSLLKLMGASDLSQEITLLQQTVGATGNSVMLKCSYADSHGDIKVNQLIFTSYRDGTVYLRIEKADGTVIPIVPRS